MKETIVVKLIFATHLQKNKALASLENTPEMEMLMEPMYT